MLLQQKKTSKSSENMPTSSLSLTADSITVLELLVSTGICPSKSEAKRLIMQGGISIDDEKATDFTQAISRSQFDKGHIIVKKGKKSYTKIVLS